MPVSELSDKNQIQALLSLEPMTHLEALDESILGVDGLVTAFCDPELPQNRLIVRWGQKSLGMGSLGTLDASRLSGLSELVEAFPAERGHIELRFPFWAAGAIAASLRSEPVGAAAVYALEQGALTSSQVVRQCVRLDDTQIVKPMFPKLAKDAPAYVLSLRDQLMAVAAVTHLRNEVARVQVYTVETARNRGFGRGVLTALCDELLALKIRPSAAIDLGHEPSVRMIEGAGFAQTKAFLKANILGRQTEASAGGLVQLGGA